MPTVIRTTTTKRTAVRVVGAHRRAHLAVVLGLELAGQRVDLGRHVAGVHPGDHERGDELEQAEDEGHVDVADDLVLMKSWAQFDITTYSRYQDRNASVAGQHEAACGASSAPGTQEWRAAGRRSGRAVRPGRGVRRVVSAMATPSSRRSPVVSPDVTPFTLADPVPPRAGVRARYVASGRSAFGQRSVLRATSGALRTGERLSRGRRSTASGVWRRTMKRVAWAGRRSGVSSEPTTIAAKARGTVQAAGWAISVENQPSSSVGHERAQHGRTARQSRPPPGRRSRRRR